MSDLDFLGQAKKKIKTATSGSPTKKMKITTKVKPKRKGTVLPKATKKVDMEKKLLPAVIAEARKLAASKKGLDIDAFFKKHNISYNIDTILHAPLDEDGNIKS